MRRLGTLIISATVLASFGSRVWGLEPIGQPPRDIVKRIDKRREGALRALNDKFGLIRKHQQSEKRGDKAQIRDLARKIEELERRYHPGRELAQVLAETRSAYRIEPTPNRGIIDGSPSAWKVEFNEGLALAEVLSFGGRRAARTSAYDGTTWFFPAAFKSVPMLASYLVHEAVHFEQLATWTSTDEATSPQEEFEAYSAQLRHAAGMGVAEKDREAIRKLADAQYASVMAQAHADIAAELAAARVEAVMPLRHGKRIADIALPWIELADKGFRSSGSPYWERRLRNERLWRHLRLTVARLCEDGGALRETAALLTILTDYSGERSFGAYRYPTELFRNPGLKACEQYVLEDHLIGAGPARLRDLEKSVHRYRRSHGPWLSRIWAFGTEAFAEGVEMGKPHRGSL